MATRTAYDASSGTVLTATNLDKHAGGWIGYVQATSNQGSITSATDLSSLSLTVTALSSRYHKTTLYLPSVSSTVANDVFLASITDGSSTQVQQASVALPVASNGQTVIAQAVETGWSGSTTRKGRLGRVTGSGTGTSSASATAPAFLLIEDMGSA